MPALSRHNAKPLLRMVNAKPHATNDDHADQLPTPPGTEGTRFSLPSSHTMNEDDINRSPVSSDDETGPSAPAALSKRPSFQAPRKLHDSPDAVAAAAFRHPLRSSPRSSLGKRSPDFRAPSSYDDSRAAADDDDSDGDAMIFSSDPSRKRAKSSSGFTNIHAQPRRRQKQYGSRQSQPRTPQKKDTGFRKPLAREVEVEEVVRPAFKRALGADVFEFGKEAGGAQFRARADLVDDRALGDERGSRSPSLSPLLSSPGIEVVEGFDVSAPTRASNVETCPICSEDVEVKLKEEFQDKFMKGAPILNYKWQQRFCRWHNEQDAKRIQMERGYPEVDWDRLQRRIQKRHGYLKDIITGNKRSYYRDRLKEMLQEGSKTALKALAADGARRDMGVGYYGPKGERVMTEYIVSHLSENIRNQAAQDRLVAAVGVSGGVSGFVQAVLVPELAEQLVQEDMKVSSVRAREIMAESADLGELLHPDANDTVVEVVDV